MINIKNNNIKSFEELKIELENISNQVVNKQVGQISTTSLNTQATGTDAAVINNISLILKNLIEAIKGQ